MRNFFRTRLAVLVLGIVVFAMVFAAAASLTVTTATLPQSGSDLTAGCDADGVTVGYTIVGATVTAIVVSGNDCATGTITLTTTAGYTFNETATQANPIPVAAFTMVTPVSIAAFDPGTITITLLP